MTTLTIEMPPELGAQLQEEAQERGVAAEEFARALIRQGLTLLADQAEEAQHHSLEVARRSTEGATLNLQLQRERNQRAIAMLRRWQEEDEAAAAAGEPPEPPLEIEPLKLREVKLD